MNGKVQEAVIIANFNVTRGIKERGEHSDGASEKRAVVANAYCTQGWGVGAVRMLIRAAGGEDSLAG